VKTAIEHSKIIFTSVRIFMNLGDCYRLLGLRSGASFADIKASYRRLAQVYHPDINPHDIKAKDKFIAVTQAYKLLLKVVPSQDISPSTNSSTNHSTSTSSNSKSTPPEKAPTTTVTTEKTPTPKPSDIFEIEERLKWKTYEQLQRFLKARRFPQSVALAEALAARLPTDTEGQALMRENQLLKARNYLQKALKTDPHNQALSLEVQRDLQKLDQLL
jgi:tetratricopeptide (TPR) repeat protein